jgi:hypothetical protein
MKLFLRHAFSFALFASLFVPGLVLAHQPIVVESNAIQVVDPEVSKAYYGQLAGQSHVYSIESAEPFELYVGVLVPDRPGQEKDVSAVVFETGKENAPIAVLDAGSFAWQPMYEQFGADNYFAGPEFKQKVPAGSYTIRVSSASNDSRYSLAVGELESFPPSVIINSLVVIPQLKRDFFASSPFTFLKSPFGIGYVVIMFVLAFIVGFVYRFIIKKLAKNSNRKSAHNIGKNDRLLRALLGVGLLIGGVYTWSPVLLFFAGFCFFEALFSWCGFYAALGKNTCPL